MKCRESSRPNLSSRGCFQIFKAKITNFSNLKEMAAARMSKTLLILMEMDLLYMKFSNISTAFPFNLLSSTVP